MLESKFTNCNGCNGLGISDLIKKIDCRLAELSYNMYNNVAFMLNNPVPSSELTKLLKYKEILIKKQGNLTLYTKTYKPGDLLSDGVVVKALPNNEYLLVNLTQESNSFSWATPGDYDYISGAIGTDIGDGKTNTDAIIDTYGEGSYAAFVTRSIYGSEWNLPSKDELNELYINKTTLEEVEGFEPFTDTFYWSSTQPDDIPVPEFYAWGQDFGGGSQNAPNKAIGSSIRGVKIYKETLEELSDTYVENFSIEDIAGKVIRLTAGCKPRCPEVNPVCVPTTTSTTTLSCEITSGEITCVEPTTTTTTSTTIQPPLSYQVAKTELAKDCLTFIPPYYIADNSLPQPVNDGDYVSVNVPGFEDYCYSIINEVYAFPDYSITDVYGSCLECQTQASLYSHFRAVAYNNLCNEKVPQESIVVRGQFSFLPSIGDFCKIATINPINSQQDELCWEIVEYVSQQEANATFVESFVDCAECNNPPTTTTTTSTILEPTTTTTTTTIQPTTTTTTTIQPTTTTTTSTALPEEARAFPTAYGAGAQASGGRGYDVYKVTSLADSGVGTFRQALLDCEANGGGNIVFDVSGTILLEDLLYIENLENVTIAGQTAPQGGIAICGTGDVNNSWALAPKILINRMRNCIWRYLRFRPDLVSDNHDNLILNNAQNFIIDHCSFAFGTDEGLDTTNLNDNFTVQYCTYNACKTGQIVGSSDDISHASSVSFNNNLFYNTSHRFANASVSGRYDNINNLIWNFNARMMVLQGDGLEMNHINNYYACIYGDINTADPTYSFGRRGVQYWWNDGVQGTVTTAPSFYTSGNDVINTSPYDDFDMFVWRFAPPVSSGYTANAEDPLPAGFESNTQFPLIGESFPIRTSTEIKDELPYEAGANALLDSNGLKYTDIDSVDQVAITNITTNNQVYYNQVFNRTQLLEIGYAEDFWDTFSLTPINTRNDDTNGDGIPEAWATANMPIGAVYSDIAPSGYSYFEEYINSIDN